MPGTTTNSSHMIMSRALGSTAEAAGVEALSCCRRAAAKTEADGAVADPGSATTGG